MGSVIDEKIVRQVGKFYCNLSIGSIDSYAWLMTGNDTHEHKETKAMYEVWSQVDAGEYCEGKRTGLRAAFAFARKLWREYRGAAKISVRLDGVVVEDEISDMSLSRKKWHVGERRGLSK